MKKLRRAYEAAVKLLESGKSAEEVAADIYANGVPGQTPESGRMMAEAVAVQVSRYYANVTAAQEDYDAWVRATEDKLTAGMNEIAAYNQLYQVYVGAIAATEINNAHSKREKRKAEKWLAEARKKVFTEEDVTPEAMEQLRRDLAEAMKNTGWITSQLDAIQEQLEDATMDAEGVVQFAAVNHDIMTILVMQSYVDVKNGDNRAIPAGTSLEEVTCAVCAAHDTCNVAAQVAAGTMTHEEGATVLGLLTAAANGLLACAVCETSALAVTGALAACTIPYVPFIAGIVTGVSILLTLGVAMIQTGFKLGNWFQNTGIVVVNAAVEGAKALSEGIKTLSEGLKNLRAAVDSKVNAVRQWFEEKKQEVSEAAGVKEENIAVAEDEVTEDETPYVPEEPAYAPQTESTVPDFELA